MVFINDGLINRMIFPKELLPDGWKLGMIRGHKTTT